MVCALLLAGVFLFACSDPGFAPAVDGDVSSGKYEGLTVQGEVLSKGAGITARVEIANTADTTASFSLIRHCSLVITMHRTAERSGPPVWASNQVAPCVYVYDPVTIAPSSVHVLSFAETDILGDSISDGRYFFSGHVYPTFQFDPHIVAPEVTFKLGNVVLRK